MAQVRIAYYKNPEFQESAGEWEEGAGIHPIESGLEPGDQLEFYSKVLNVQLLLSDGFRAQFQSMPGTIGLAPEQTKTYTATAAFTVKNLEDALDGPTPEIEVVDASHPGQGDMQYAATFSTYDAGQHCVG